MMLQRTVFSLLAAGTLLVGSGIAQTNFSPTPQSQEPVAPQTQNGSTPAVIPSGVVIPAQLSKSVDAKKAKPGDKVEAKTTMDLLSHGQVVIPRDTKVIGHVTAAKPHSKESPDSNIALAFDRISLKDGRDVPVKASVQAIGRSLSAQPASVGDSAGAPPADMPSSGSAGSRGTMAGSSRPSGSSSYPSSTPPSSTPNQVPSGATGTGSPAGVALDPHSQGVIGMKGLVLQSAGEASVISSTSNNVHLDSGTQMVLRTE
jgi:hypothetical protein